MSINTDADRRRFFRITDALGVSYRVIDSDEGQDADPASEPLFESVNTYEVMNNHNKIISDALGRIQTRDVDVALAIEQMNKKLDSLLMMFELDNLKVQRMAHRVEEASISACGVGFAIDELIAPGTILALDLLLKPSAQHVRATGNVVGCAPIAEEEGKYYLRVEFMEIHRADRERLIQHIVQRQGELLRALKSSIDDEPEDE